MGRNNKSLNHQFHERMEQLNCIGESRHLAKAEYKQYCQANGLNYNPCKTVGIHSFNTYESYKQTSKEFTSWIKSNYPEIKNINHITKDMCVNYLRMRQETCSAYTVSKDMSALNKLLGHDIRKSEADLRERSYKDVTRSRYERQHDANIDTNRYSKQIMIANAFGLRRESFVTGQYALKDVSIYSNKGELYCSVIEKGGRYRNAPCLENYKELLKNNFNIYEREHLTINQFKEIYADSTNKLFIEYDTKIDNHAYRSEYATNLYHQLASSEPVELYRGWDKEAVQQVSHALGHNRLNVVVEHYLKIKKEH